MHSYDHREAASFAKAWYKSLDEQTMTATMDLPGAVEEAARPCLFSCYPTSHLDFEGPLEPCCGCGNCVEEVTVRFTWVLCPTCRGRGRHVNPSIDAGGITESEMEELGPEFLSDYRAGVYDIPCNGCNGLRVVPVPAETGHLGERIRRYLTSLEEEAAEEYRAARMGY